MKTSDEIMKDIQNLSELDKIQCLLCIDEIHLLIRRFAGPAFLAVSFVNAEFRELLV